MKDGSPMDIKASPEEISALVALVLELQERRKPEFVAETSGGAPCLGPLLDTGMFSNSGD